MNHATHESDFDIVYNNDVVTMMIEKDSNSQNNIERSPPIAIIPSVAQISYTIYFRPIQESDRKEIEELHEELFPVAYTDYFYDNVVQNMSMNDQPLFSCVAVAREDDEENSFLNRMPETNIQYDAWKKLAKYIGIDNLQPGRLHDRWKIKETVSEDHLTSSASKVLQGDAIIGCVVGTFIDVEEGGMVSIDTVEKLVLNTEKHTQLFYIMTLGSTENFRGRGLATKLILDCINLVEQVHNCGAIYLHVITYNTTAIRFYERLGFYRIEEIRDYYTIDDKKYNCYLYAKFVNGKSRFIHPMVMTVVVYCVLAMYYGKFSIHLFTSIYNHADVIVIIRQSTISENNCGCSL